MAAGERGTDLAVRLGYAGVEHTLVHDTVRAIDVLPAGPRRGDRELHRFPAVEPVLERLK